MRFTGSLGRLTGFTGVRFCAELLRRRRGEVGGVVAVGVVLLLEVVGLTVDL